MSELIYTTNDRGNIRRKFLGTVSMLTLLSCLSEPAIAEDNADRPTLWIELGGQFERVDRSQEIYAPPFSLKKRGVPDKTSPNNPTPYPNAVNGDFGTISPFGLENPSPYSYGAEGKISFEPAGSDWIFLASVRYGRSNANRHAHQRTTYLTTSISSLIHGRAVIANKFSDTKVTTRESHAVVDFQAGKDLGLGLFSKSGTFVLDAGLRFAQFTSRSSIHMNLDPDAGFLYKYLPQIHRTVPLTLAHHSYAGALYAQRSFIGAGPSISWHSTAPFLGNKESGEVALDLGASAAILFGRQKARTMHQTSGALHKSGPPTGHRTTTQYQIPAVPHTRSRTVTVPDIGGFAGFSMLYPNAKVSIGYRADFFWGAMDGGIETRKSENVGFYGPFASVSVGLGG